MCGNLHPIVRHLLEDDNKIDIYFFRNGLSSPFPKVPFFADSFSDLEVRGRLRKRTKAKEQKRRKMGKRNDDNYEARKLLSIKYLEHDPAQGWIVGKSAFSQFFTLKVVIEENFMQPALSLPLLCSFQTGERSKSLQMITVSPGGGGSGQIISVLLRGGPPNDYSIPWFWEEYTLNMIKRQQNKTNFFCM